MHIYSLQLQYIYFHYFIQGGKVQIQFLAVHVIHMIQIELLVVQAVVKDVYKYVYD